MPPASPLLVSPFPLHNPARLLISATPGHSSLCWASTRTSRTASSSWRMHLPLRTTPLRTTPALTGDTTSAPAEHPRPSADLDHARAFAAAHGLDQDIEDRLLELAHALAAANDAGAHRGHHARAHARCHPRPPADPGHARAFAAAHGLDQDLEDRLLKLAHALAAANDAGAHRGHHARAR